MSRLRTLKKKVDVQGLVGHNFLQIKDFFVNRYMKHAAENSCGSAVELTGGTGTLNSNARKLLSYEHKQHFLRMVVSQPNYSINANSSNARTKRMAIKSTWRQSGTRVLGIGRFRHGLHQCPGEISRMRAASAQNRKAHERVWKDECFQASD